MSLTQFSDSYILDSFESSYYELLEKIGEGGFGKVFKAKQKSTGQMVAIKFLAIEPHCEEQKKQRYIERFKRETSLSSQLQHPNIVRLLDQGQVNDDLLFGVFEYVEGRSLREHLLLEGPFSAPEATDIMSQVLDALIHAHSKGIVHRDIKPANIMLSKTGAKLHAKILDFGIGTLTHDSRQADFRTLTLTQETLGTPSYSAPEQLRGEPATTKTDLYVWGLVYLECLTGSPAMNGTSVASIYHKQLSDAHIPMPSALLGHPLSGLLRRVLNKNAIERVITGEEAFNELKAINVSNLVGILVDNSQVLADDETLIMRADGDNQQSHAFSYTSLTERKQITVLALRFSTTFTDQREHDLDVIDTLFKSQRNHCIDVAVRFGAFHVGSVADTSLFYFGHPTASENDTRLSARSALEIISEISKRNALMQDAHGAILNVHLGIHTGVFVTYSNSTPEGHVANVAMALARTAKEKQILCSLNARSILDPYSEFENFVELKLGQSIKPEPVFELKGERRVEAFGFMRGTRNNYELIGRRKELNKLMTFITNPASKIKVAHIFGEAGIGKSRLIQEVRANSTKHQQLVAQCLPEHQNSALYPVLNLVRHLFNIDSLNTRKIVDLFTSILKPQMRPESSEFENTLSILMVWLNVELNNEQKPSTLSPELQKKLLFNGLSSLLLFNEYSLNEFKLFIFEDIHWADTTSIEFLAYFGSSLNNGQVLLSTSRTPAPSKFAQNILEPIHVHKLTEQDTESFIIKLFNNQLVSKQVIETLITRTDGIPLFIEELATMLEQKSLVKIINGQIEFISPDKLAQVPLSLRESLQQKLSNLNHAKETAQLAATIGREFDYELLVLSSNLSENQIQNDLQELIDNDVIVIQRRSSANSYIFKHALVRDAAYESMQIETLLRSHKVLAQALELMTTTCSNNNYLTIFKAYQHYKSAHLWLKAVEQSRKLIEIKVSMSSSFEAISIFNSTIELFEKHSSSEMALLESQLYQEIYPAFFSYYGLGSQELIELSDRAQLLKKDSFITDWGKFQELHVKGKCLEAEKLGNNMLEADYGLTDQSIPKILVLPLLAQNSHWQGKLYQAVNLCEQALALYKPEHLNLWKEYGFESKSSTLWVLSHIYTYMGEVQKAKELVKESRVWAKKSGCELSINGSILHEAVIHFHDGDKKEAKSALDQHVKTLSPEAELQWMDKFIIAVYEWSTSHSEYTKRYINELIDTDINGFIWVHFLTSILTKENAATSVKACKYWVERNRATHNLSTLPFSIFELAKAQSAMNNGLTNKDREDILDAISLSESQGAYLVALGLCNEWESIESTPEGKSYAINRLQDLMYNIPKLEGSSLYNYAKSKVC
ncbi:TOMM system kinase/cyclase fusion protein [Pseudoalteromonas luteoviolacea]|uniref:TOMM system kinase/cyclase fusion protein n=1 Tax=Pseudoalteromonas luteoviolacea TaxID=43657 RepID=UPI001F422220|nr:TOMM system kinase/cyclase fusion protein [Pseudoalteromonas luteoviolacea]MCF6439366.1 TOMM system kinase/cyclase fusion protein [Pseudoalteromonas luteoviolacea]